MSPDQGGDIEVRGRWRRSVMAVVGRWLDQTTTTAPSEPNGQRAQLVTGKVKLEQLSSFLAGREKGEGRVTLAITGLLLLCLAAVPVV